MKKCLFCGVETKNPKFCSRGCSASFSNKIPKRKRSRKCKGCDNFAATGRTYCSVECMDTTRFGYAKDQTLADVIYDRHHKSSAYALVRARARMVMKDCIFCEECGYDKHVEIAHIKPIASFSDDTLVTVVNARSNLRALCPNCHWEFDNC